MHHTRLRLGCSKLKAHLHFELFVEDNPDCICGQGNEDPFHFFFVCPRYAQYRLVLFQSISQITNEAMPRLSLLLSGDLNLSYEQNTAIFKHVHNFIKSSGRFDV